MHVVGTAGHVDHGKSTLITALTGMDPDRFAEEKRRGMTIDLGFAWMTLPSGREVGFVDVPGHRRFIGNMLAGVGSIDAILFVVAANEGWMPQSEEHLAILELLGVDTGIVALTKTDLVDADLVGIARDEIRARVGTRWQLVNVATPTGDGLDELRAALDALLAMTPSAPDDGRPRLWVDRSFTIRGAGTVVTGTLTGGSIRVDDQVTVLPRGRRARIRAVHTHQVARQVAEPGSRVALNLSGVDASDVSRGDAVVFARQWRVTDRVDAHVLAVPGTELAPKGAYVMYVGTAHTAVRLQFSPGRTFVRARLADALPLAPGDRFIVREMGRQRTVGGGHILDVDPQGRLDEDRLTHRLNLAAPANLLDVLLAERDFVPADAVEPLTGAKLVAGERFGDSYVGAERVTQLAARASQEVVAFHRDHPLEPGMPRELLRSQLDVPSAVLATLLVRADLGVNADLVRAPSHRVVTESVEATLAQHALAPPPIKELGVSPRAVHLLAREGRVVLAGPFAFGRAAFDQACGVVRATIDAEGPQTTSALRDALGITRKHAVPLLEAMDAAGVTRRIGDRRH